MGRYSAPSLLKAILIGGFLAALLDILDAITFFYVRNRVAPIRIFQSIASGLLGRPAYTGGIHTALLGAALHCLIALIWATVFVLCARVLPVLGRRAILAGILYGLFVYGIMNYVVLPHSRVYQAARVNRIVLINGVFAVVCLVGLPISLVNRRFASRAAGAFLRTT